METENEILNATLRRGKYRSNLPLPRGTNISKFGYQEVPKPLHLPSIEAKPEINDRKMCLSSINIGERVCVSGTKLGVLRFYGNTSFASGWWCGIELDEAIGKNSGEIDGVKYFECRENHGIFAPPTKVELLTDVSAKMECGDGVFEAGNSNFVPESGEKVTKSKLMAPKVYPKSLPPVTRNVNNCSYVVQSDVNTTRVLNVTVNIGNSTFDKSPEVINKMNSTFSTFDKSPEVINKTNSTFSTFDKSPEVINKTNSTFSKDPEEKSYVLPEIEDEFASKLIADVSDDVKMAEDSGDFGPNEAKIGLDVEKDDFESFDFDDSLGILTPNQMIDSMFGDSLLKTPSFEDVLELNDEIVEFEETVAVTTSTPVLEKEKESISKQPDIWTEQTPKARPNESFFYLSQFDSTLENSSKNTELTNLSPIARKNEKKRDLESLHLTLVADNLSKEVINDSLHHVIEKISDKDRPMSSLTMSVTSIDTGYQGDAEGDVHSGAPSAANTPIEDQNKFGVDEKDLLSMISCDGHNFLRHPRTDVGSDSDFCSDMGTSWTESEMENEEKGRGRAARVIDGTLYYNDVNNEVNNNHVTCDIVIPSCRVKEEVPDRSSDSSTLDETLTELLPTSVDVVTVVSRVECEENVVDVKVADKKLLAVRKETPIKKFKSPKKNVMSKIKAMIEATTCKSAGSAHGGGEDGSNEAEVVVGKKAGSVRTPRKSSRWEAVMSKIAAGQAEEKAKGKAKAKREVRSRVNTNLGAAKVKNTTTRLVKRDSTLSELSENVSEVGDNLHSNRSSRSDVSSGKRKPRSARISTTTERPLSPSQLSDISTMSAASHFSSLSQTSHRASTSLLSFRGTNQIEKELNLSDRPKSTISPTVLKNNRKNVANSPMKKPPSGVLAAKKVQSSLANGGPSRTAIATPKTATLASKRANSAAQSRLATTSRVSNKSVPAASQVQLSAKAGGSDPATMSFMRRDKERRRSNSLQISKNGATDSMDSSPKHTPAPSLADLSRDEQKNRSKRWRSGSFAKLFRLCGSNLSKAEQNRVRNLKTAPVIKSGHHQPDLLNLSSAVSRETEEIKRLETVCEGHAKEISRLRSLLEQRTMGFEAFTVFAKYLVEDLDSFAHPSMIKEMEKIRRSLDACKVDLGKGLKDRAILEKSDLIVGHQNELDKLKQGHECDVTALKEMIGKNYEEEIKKLNEEFNESKIILNEKHAAEILELREMDEELYKEKWNEQLNDFRSQHSLQINTIETEYDLKVEELTKEFNGINYNLEQQLKAMVTKCSDLHRQKREYEDALLKDNNSKLQIVAGTISDLQKEIESLKAVIELRNCEIHELRAVSNKVTTLEEELYLSEEKIKLLSTKTEDLQAQVDLKNSKERQLTTEQQALKNFFEKETQMNKRLSMENEELQWKLAKSMEAPSLTALFENTSPNTSIDNSISFMTTSTPLMRGASDGEMHKNSPCKRSLPFSSNKTIPSQRSSLINRDERARHHRQRFSISENDGSMAVRDVSPAARYRRAQSLSWTVGINDFKTDVADPKLDETVLEGETSRLNGETEQNEEENVEKETENVKPAILEAAPSQVVITHAALQRRNSISPDARVPSLITMQYIHEQSSARSKRERRNSLGNLKHAEESSFTSRSCRSLSTPHDFLVRKKSPRNSPVKTKQEVAARLKAMEKEEEEEFKMEESQESVNQMSMTDSEEFSAPLTTSVNSCDSSPLPEPNDSIDQSSRSEDSSPRASPQFRSKVEKDSLGVYTMSPRMSAGESMILDDVPKENRSDASDLLLRRTFPEFYAGAKDLSSVEDNQGTPESGSLGVLPTDSTNIDLSWSEDEDEIPSESEV
uniref:CAP-Gly domain-containing protein n=1 Tax=Strigamia maritima TaxID=126957 RepID=T1J0J4_STRMM